ncbi:hypothetical protein [Okeania sp. KiyG1]|uniref:hypothetical protein n=1 Tax=Okeania sp. KiyG1 TaxID=2720165 RepID=UPI0019243075|nr:hypothetical protein [Okeania sp. KiyG1]GGA57874.1 hypothetical protein CYANOKiyG1_79000 [Okeania sp. KiyG1]
MPNCPICNTEYQQQQVNFCLTCGWYLKLYSSSADGVLEGSGLSSSDALKQVENWARRMWQASSKTPLLPKEQESQLQQLRAEYEELQAEFQQSQQERSLEIVEKLNDLAEQVVAGNKEQVVQKSQLSMIETNLQNVLAKFSQQIDPAEKPEFELPEIVANLNEQLELGNQEQARLQSQLSTIETKLQELSEKLSQQSSQDELLERISQQISPLIERLEKIEQSSSQNEISTPPSLTDINLSWQETELAAIDNASPDSLLETAIEEIPPETPTLTPEPKQKLTPEPKQKLTPEPKPEPPVILPPLPPEEAILVELYNSSRSWRSKRPTTVSKVNESSDAVVLKKEARWGRYWILSEESGDYLAPQANTNINPDKNEDVQGLFKCDGDWSGESKQFQLLKPAKVEPTGDGGKWKVVALGVLNFESRKLEDDNNSENENQTKES